MSGLIHHEAPSPNWDERELPVSMVVLHYTGMPDAKGALERMCDAAAKVSAHYMIDEDGTVTRMVDEEKRAWHAGRSYWRGLTDINSASVGIELVNPGHEWGYRAFPDAQMQSLIPLLHTIVKRYKMPFANIVGHSDVAPSRKEDPGELFDWQRLAALKLALPRPTVTMPSPYPNDGAFYLALERFGYDIADGLAAVRAFQRRWRPETIDGVIDGECSAILFALLLDRDQGRAR